MMLNRRAEGPDGMWLRPARWNKMRDINSKSVASRVEITANDWRCTQLVLGKIYGNRWESYCELEGTKLPFYLNCDVIE